MFGYKVDLHAQLKTQAKPSLALQCLLNHLGRFTHTKKTSFLESKNPRIKKHIQTD